MSNYKIRISAKGFFFNSKNEVLLVLGTTKKDGKSFYCAPGGGAEEGENLFRAVERELVEETGFSGKASKVVFCQDLKYFANRCFEVFFIGKLDEVKKRQEEFDHKTKFVSKEEFENIEFYPKGINPFKLRAIEGVDYKTCL